MTESAGASARTAEHLCHCFEPVMLTTVTGKRQQAKPHSSGEFPKAQSMTCLATRPFSAASCSTNAQLCTIPRVVGCKCLKRLRSSLGAGGQAWNSHVGPTVTVHSRQQEGSKPRQFRGLSSARFPEAARSAQHALLFGYAKLCGFAQSGAEELSLES